MKKPQGQFHHLYNNKRWLVRRLQQLRAHPLCAMCLERGIVTSANVADHREPHNGDLGKFWNGELQSLCKTCHDSAKQIMELGGVVEYIGVDGWPLENISNNKKETVFLRNKKRLF